MENRISRILVILILFILVACNAEPNEPIAATRPAATPTQIVEPTTETVATEAPAATEPANSQDLAAFIGQLQTAVTNQAYADMQALMSDPIAFGPWRSEWSRHTPAQAIELFQNAAVPSPFAVQFMGLDNDALTTLIGQPPATLFGPEVNVVAALHSTGWGQSTSDEAILFVTEADGRYTWSGFLYANGRFADAYLGTISAPVGLIYHIGGDGVYQIQADGQHRQLLNAQDSNIPNLRVAPDGRHAAYTNEQQQLWLIDTTTSEQQRYAANFTPSGYLQWGDKNILFVGIWLGPNEADGPNNGHIATLNISSGDLHILDETRLSGSRPALLSDYNMVAFDVFTDSQDDIFNGRLYHPDTGLRVFGHTAFAGNSANPLQNPSWSPDPTKIAWLSRIGEQHVVQLFDSEAMTAVTLFDWDPARFGGLIPSPVWSPDGQWLALEVWANTPESSGLWLLAADGSSQTLIDAAGHDDPYWVNNSQLVFAVGGAARLYDVIDGTQFKLDLPTGNLLLGITSEADMGAVPDEMPVAETDPATLPDPADLVMIETEVASPDDRWQVTTSQSEAVTISAELQQFYTTLTVSDGATAWQPVAEWRNDGLGYERPQVHQWSADGRYLYYANVPVPDGCPGFVNGGQLWQLDLDSGQIREIAPYIGLVMALSPDEQQLAVNASYGRGFLIRTLDTGQEQSISLPQPSPNWQMGQMQWSANGQHIALIQQLNLCAPDNSSAIVRIDVATQTAVTVLEAAAAYDFQQLTWIREDEVQLVDVNGRVWYLDIISGEIATGG